MNQYEPFSTAMSTTKQPVFHHRPGLLPINSWYILGLPINQLSNISYCYQISHLIKRQWQWASILNHQLTTVKLLSRSRPSFITVNSKSSVTGHHWASLGIINHYEPVHVPMACILTQQPSINHHFPLLTVEENHQPLSNIIQNHHSPPLTYMEISQIRGTPQITTINHLQ